MSCDVDMFHHLRDRCSSIDTRWRSQYATSILNTVPWYDHYVTPSTNQSINQSVLSTHPAMLENLTFERLLVGHEGCINRLAFNASGTLLASGSDDCNVLIHQWLKRDKYNQSINQSTSSSIHNQPIKVETGHEANIFAVGFLNNDRSVVSAGMDAQVRVTDIEQSISQSIYHCHCGERVKELCVDPSNDQIILTAAEDGSCRQYDQREPHACTQSFTGRNRWMRNRAVNRVDPCRNAIVKFARLPLKCVEINPVNYNLFLIAADDPYIRIFDRRMVSINRSTNQSVDDANQSIKQATMVGRYAASHLDQSITCTYAQWDETGSQIVASYSGEQVYLYDCLNGSNDDLMVRSINKTFFNDIAGYEEFLQPEEKLANQSDKQSNNQPEKQSNNQSNKQSNSQSPKPLVQKPNVSEPIDHSDEKELEQKSPGSTDDLITRSASHQSINLHPMTAEYRDAGNESFRAKDYSSAISSYTAAVQFAANQSGAQHSILYSNRSAAFLKRALIGDANRGLLDAKTAFYLDPLSVKAAYRAILAHKLMKHSETALRLADQASHYFHRLADAGHLERSLLNDLDKELNNMKADKATREKAERDKRKPAKGTTSAARSTTTRTTIPTSGSTSNHSTSSSTSATSQPSSQVSQISGQTSESTNQSSTQSPSTIASASVSTDDEEKQPLVESDSPLREGKRKLSDMPGASDEGGDQSISQTTNDEKKARRESTDQSSIHNNEQSTTRLVDQSTESLASTHIPASNETVEHVADQSVEQSNDQSNNQSNDQSTDQSTIQSTDQPNDQPRGQSSDQSTDQSASQPTDEHPARRRGRVNVAVPGLGMFSIDFLGEDGDDDEDVEKDDEAESDEEAETVSMLLDDLESDEHHEEAESDEEDADYGEAESDEEDEDDEHMHSDSESVSDAPHEPQSSSTNQSNNQTNAQSNIPWSPVKTSHSYLNAYVGHANVQTDIKEATFWGCWILSGSDDGHVFVWDRHTARLHCVLKASHDVINCVRGHPYRTEIATSGIDSEIGVWSLDDTIEKADDEFRCVLRGDAMKAKELASANAARMRRIRPMGPVMGDELLQLILAGLPNLREMFTQNNDDDE